MKKQPLKIIAGAPDRPLVIGDIEISCYVLEDETRVLSQGGFLTALGRHGRPQAKAKDHIEELPRFIESANLKPFVSSDLIKSSKSLPFRAASGGSIGHGYSALLLPQVCEVYLKAREAGALRASQRHIAERAELLMRGLATVGVIALVDEATGYQRLREERALATILEKFIAKELQPWTRTFQYEFYEQIFRLKGWPGPNGTKRPVIIAQYTNDIVYERLAPGVLDDLKRLNPTIPGGGRRRHKHFQWFTPNFGHPKLKEHLAAVTALMRAAPNWNSFQRSLNRAFQKRNQTIPMNFGDEP